MSIEKLKIQSPQELEQLITAEISKIEKDLTVICNNVPINDKTTLDILCHDGNGQLVIVQLSANEEDIMLLRGIQSLDYIDKFKSFLKATYNKHKIDDKAKPRLILIAPSFSNAILHTVEGMKGIHIDLYEWEYLKLGDHKGFRLQPLFAWTHAEKSKEQQVEEEKTLEKKRESKPAKKKESLPEPTIEKVEEPEPEREPPKDDFPMFPPQEEEPKEKKEEPPKKKLKLF